MKRICFILVLVLAVSFFGCLPTIPSDIQIIGKPELKFTANMDFSEMFSDIVSKAFKDDGNGNNPLVLQNCINVPDIQTFLICMNAINEEFEFAPVEDGSSSLPEFIEINGVKYPINTSQAGENYLITLDEDIPLFNSNSAGGEPMTLPLSNLVSSMYGFKFDTDNLKARLYLFSEAEEIVEEVTIDIRFVAVDESGNEVNDIDIPSLSLPLAGESVITLSKSNIDLNSKEYAATGLPAGGYNIDSFADMLNAGRDFHVKIEVILPAGSTFSIEELGATVDLTAEIVVWLPLVLKAEEEANISMDEFLGEIGSFINGLTDFFQYLDGISLKVEINDDVFNEGNFIMSYLNNNGIPERINNPMTDKTINLKIEGEDLEKIKALENDFEPKFNIEFGEGTILSIPKEFTLNSLSLEASINFKL